MKPRLKKHNNTLFRFLKGQGGRFDLKAAFALLLFIGSALIPIGIYYFIVEKDMGAGVEVDPVFPSSIAIRSRGTFFKVLHNDKLNPVPDEDFVLVSWFKLAELPTAEQEMVLINKSDPARRTPNGYTLKLIRSGYALRPLVTWHEMSGKGGKYEFTDLHFDTDVWYGFILTYRAPNILGLHLIEQREHAKPVRSLLGAYQLKIPIYPATNVDLLVGASRFGTFRGAIGPVGIIRGKNITKDIRHLVKSIAEEPQRLQSVFPKDQLVFFTINGKEDISTSKLQIVTSDNLMN